MIGLIFSFLSACCLCYSTFGKKKENILIVVCGVAVNNRGWQEHPC